MPGLSQSVLAIVPLFAPTQVKTLPITTWPSLRQARQGTTTLYRWQAFQELHSHWARQHIPRTHKDNVPVYSPIRSFDGRRRGESVAAIAALILDHDAGQPWTQLEERLRQLRLAHILHESRSSTPECPRWRCILPITEVRFDEEPERSWWMRAYRQVATEFGVLGGVEFDPATADAGRIWHFGVALDGAPERRVVATQGRMLDGARILAIGRAQAARAVVRAKETGKGSGVKPQAVPPHLRQLEKLFAARGEVGIKTGNKLYVRCPWNAEHSKPDLATLPSGDTVVFLNEDYFFCSHAHCRGQRTRNDVIKVLK